MLPAGCARPFDASKCREECITVPKITPFLWFNNQAMEAMLQVVKLDVAVLKRAYHRK